MDIRISAELLNRGFNDVTSPNGIYYQSWSGKTPTINTGSTGLQNFGWLTFNAFL